MIVLHDPATLLHNTVELLGAKTIPALESPERIRTILSSVTASRHDLRLIESSIKESGDLNALLQLVESSHDSGYLEHIRSVFDAWCSAKLIGPAESVLPECFVFPTVARATPRIPKDIFARAGYYAFDMSSGIMDKTYVSTIASANLAWQSVRLLTQSDKELKDVFALCRPPGHHCDGRRAGGYCYINNAAVAVAAWRKHSTNARVGILDIDFHHGNGTQEIYYSDPGVFYTSIHGEDEFPYYTGMSDETGEGEAVGTNLNLPLKTGSSFEEYLVLLDQALTALSDFKVEFMVVSLGFDTFHLDPLGNFKIDTDDYAALARNIRQRLLEVPAVILLEGGYVLEHLGANVLSFIEGWENVKSPDE